MGTHPRLDIWRHQRTSELGSNKKAYMMNNIKERMPKLEKQFKEKAKDFEECTAK